MKFATIILSIALGSIGFAQSKSGMSPFIIAKANLAMSIERYKAEKACTTAFDVLDIYSDMNQTYNSANEVDEIKTVFDSALNINEENALWKMFEGEDRCKR